MNQRAPFTRSSQRWVGGVAAGLAQRLGIDPALIRALLLLLTLVGGAGLILYGLAWLLLPQSDSPSLGSELLHGRPHTDVIWTVVMVVAGLTHPIFWWDRWQWSTHPFYWLSVWALTVAVALAAVALTLSWRARRRRQRLEGTLPFAAPPPAPAAASSVAPSPSSAPTQSLPTPSDDDAPSAPPAGAPGVLLTPSEDDAATIAQPAATADAPAPPPVLTVTHAPRPRPAGPGRRQWQLTLAAMLLAAAVVVGKDTEDLNVLTWLLLAGVELTILGASVVIAGLRGRRGGGITALATLGALVAVPALVLGTLLPADALASGRIGGCWLGQAPASGSVSATCTAGVGQVQVRRGVYSDVTLTNGLGYTEIAVENGAAVRITGRVGAGELSIDVPAGWDVLVDGEPMSPNAYADYTQSSDPGDPNRYYVYVQKWSTEFELVSPAAQHGGRAATVTVEQGIGGIQVSQMQTDTGDSNE